MTKLSAYQSALTLYGSIFLRLKEKEERYFLAAIKHDFVFFLFALIWKGSGSSDKEAHHLNFAIGNRFFPRNFNEWKFGGRFISFNGNDPAFWNADKDYFREDKIVKRSGEKTAVLSYGLDLERIFTIEEISEKEKIGAVIDWKGDLKGSRPFKIIGKYQFFISPFFYYFLLKKIRTLFRIYGFLAGSGQSNLSLFDFMRYFVYCAFNSARIRGFLNAVSEDESIGAVIFSDLDNNWGNSFLFWSRFYGFKQICYPHGSSLYFNKNRYFNPEICYVYTAEHKKAIEKEGNSTEIILFPFKWLKKYSSGSALKEKEKISNIVLITGMEKNSEVPFSDKKILTDYIEAISRFVCQKKMSLTIKSHKLLDWHKEYDDFALKYPCVKHIKERWSVEDLKKTDLAILMNPETTLILQILLIGVPVITCDEVISKIWTEHFSTRSLQFTVNTKKELFEIMERLLTDKEFYEKTRAEAVSISRSVMDIKSLKTLNL